MFGSMFSGCTSLGTDATVSYVPATLFKNVEGTTYGSNAMSSIFYNTALDTQCPAGTKPYETGFESYWNNKISCIPADKIVCASNNTGASYQCESCSGETGCPTIADLYQCPQPGYIGNIAANECIAVEPYTITYHNDGVTTQTEYSNDVLLNLPVPTKEGYAFVGWYDNEQFNKYE